MLQRREAVRRLSNSLKEERVRQRDLEKQDVLAAPEADRKGNYHNDYSPRYEKPYDIYEKVRSHVKKLKKNQNEMK